MGFFDKLKSKVVSTASDLADEVSKGVKSFTDGLEDVQSEDTRREVVKLLVVISYSDSEIDEKELAVIEGGFTDWYSDDTVSKWVDSFISDIKDDSSKNDTDIVTTVRQNLFMITDSLSKSLSNKQKEELTKLIVSVIESDGEIKETEKEFLQIYKQQIGLDDSSFFDIDFKMDIDFDKVAGDIKDTIKSNTQRFFNDECPYCGSHDTKDINKEKSTIKSYTKKVTKEDKDGFKFEVEQTVEDVQYKVTTKCNSCQKEWTKEKTETVTV